MRAVGAPWQAGGGCTRRAGAQPRAPIDLPLFPQAGKLLEQRPGALLSLGGLKHALQIPKRHAVAAEDAAGLVDWDVLPISAREPGGCRVIRRHDRKRIDSFHKGEQVDIAERDIVDVEGHEMSAVGECLLFEDQFPDAALRSSGFVGEQNAHAKLQRIVYGE